MKLILASTSPRRKILLEEAGFFFLSHPKKVSEIIDETLNLDEALMDLAQKKAQATRDDSKWVKEKEILILAADTVVSLDGKILGKPLTKVEARDFLTRLSGREHDVKTAVALWSSRDQKWNRFCETTRVFFKKLSATDIEKYISTDEPYDKAGGYGIQGQAQGFVEKIVGSYSNVVGLPMERLKQVLRENGWNIDR